jgi:hypothetical protein
MKMKRTLAGLAAGLVAVSAMATAVSADQESINLHYDLRTKVTTKEEARATLTENWVQTTGTQVYKATPKITATQTPTIYKKLNNAQATKNDIPAMIFGFDGAYTKAVDYNSGVDKLGDITDAVFTFTCAPKQFSWSYFDSKSYSTITVTDRIPISLGVVDADNYGHICTSLEIGEIVRVTGNAAYDKNDNVVAYLANRATLTATTTLKYTTDATKASEDTSWNYVPDGGVYKDMIDTNNDGTPDFKIFDGKQVRVPVSFTNYVKTELIENATPVAAEYEVTGYNIANGESRVWYVSGNDELLSGVKVASAADAVQFVQESAGSSDTAASGTMQQGSKAGQSYSGIYWFNGGGTYGYAFFSDSGKTASAGDPNAKVMISYIRGDEDNYYESPMSNELELGKFNLELLGYSWEAGDFVKGTSDPYYNVEEAYGFTQVSAAITYKTNGFFDENLISGWTNLHDQLSANYYFTGMDLSWLGIAYTSESSQQAKRLISGAYSTTSAIDNITYGIIAGVISKAGEKKDHYYPLWTCDAVRPYYSTSAGYTNGDINKPIASGTLLYTNDVIAAIRRSGVGTSPLSVINDAIANDLDVQFTFTTSNYHVGTTATHAVYQWANIGEGFDYDIKNSWYKTAFGQHLYANKYSTVASPYSGASFTPAYTYNASDATSDMYGSYSSAWAQNLVSAGLVVNSELTMQLNDTKKLVWNENQLTFNWFDVTDETKITRANQLLTTMLLYTPVDWFWDSLDVVVIEPEEEEDVNAGEGIEEDGEVLDEEIEEEEIEEEEEEEEDWEEEEEEEEPEIEEPEVEETEVEVVEVAPVASPKTGNSPIALAVIPVALAAAAVVAKKRG